MPMACEFRFAVRVFKSAVLCESSVLMTIEHRLPEAADLAGRRRQATVGSQSRTERLLLACQASGLPPSSGLR